jgi:uncharacterized membrane protein
METLLVVCLLAVALIRWLYLRERLAEIEARLDTLARRVGQSERPVPGVVERPRRETVAPEPVQFPDVPKAATVAAKNVGQIPDLPKPEPIVAPPQPKPVTHAPDLPRPERPPVPAFPTPVPAPQAPAPGPWPPAPAFPAPTQAPTPNPQPLTPDFETLVGGNFLNKVGVFVLVIGIALALGYSFTRVGPAGRVAISLAASLAMLVSGAAIEPRDHYRTFARGLLGGGWSALYFTVYAMQSLDAARVIHNPWLGAILLLAVSAGMVAHSLRYRSETVTGLAYFIAFVTLAITQVTALSVVALVPLAASLLYVAHRFSWRTFALFGLIATYVTCASRGDTGAPLWQAQVIFAVYWLLFEAFDILQPNRALLPLNALGFLGLSLAKWDHTAPERTWQLLAATAAAYLASSILRARSGRWHAAATLTAALAAAAIFLRLDHQWIALALLVEAELFYLTGVRFRAPYLRHLGASLFAVELGHLIVIEVPHLAVRDWTSIAALDAAVFYANRALCKAGLVYSYAAAGMMALVAGYEVPAPYLGRAWFLLAATTFVWGWWRRLPDFRFQAYGLATLAALGTALYAPHPPLALATGAACGFAAALCALWSAPGRFFEREREALRLTASLATTCMLAALVWRLVPHEYLGLAWMALAIPLLELGLRNLPAEFRNQSYAVALLGAAVVLFDQVLPIHNDGPLTPRLIPAGAALLAYAIAARVRKAGGGRVLDVASFTGTGFLLTCLWALLPPAAVGPAWAAVALILAEFEIPVLRLQGHLVSGAAFARLFFANLEVPQRLLTVLPVLLSHYYLWWRTRKRFYLYTAAILAAVLMRFEMGRVFTVTGWALFALALLYAGLRWNLEDLRWQSHALAAAAFVRCWSTNFYSPEMFAAIAGPVLTGAIAIASFYAAQLLLARGGRPRLFYSLLATSLLAVLLFYEVSGSLLTVAWGLEGVALLAAGFPLRDRVLRFSGMALLHFCILKLFLWDLRHLETLPRILSFIVLGLILVGVSWIYTRFRERVERYL